MRGGSFLRENSRFRPPNTPSTMWNHRCPTINTTTRAISTAPICPQGIFPPPYFVLNLVMKNSVNAFNSSSWET